MNKLFLDANIFFAATYSTTGGSRFIFELAKKQHHILVSNMYAVTEAQTNIAKKLSLDHLRIFFQLLAELHEVDKSKNYLDHKEYASLINQKDLPVLLGAVRTHADFLITLDRKDFMTKALADTKLPFRILTPGEYLSTAL